MAKDEHRFSLSAEKYLEKHNVLTYIEDSVTQLLDHKDEHPKVNPTKFFSDYFTSVKEGNHVMFREYAFVRATAHNRASFVRMFWKCFRNIGRKGDLLSIKEYHSLICLLCPNFPFEPVQTTARIILMDDALDSLISFADFLYAFQIQFCYEEFLKHCAEIYTNLLQKPQNSHGDTVVVPTSEESPTVHKNNERAGSTAEGADANVFFRSLLPVCEKLDILAPPITIMRDILSSVQRVTFYGFLMALAKSNELNESIGKLPNKGAVWDVSDHELTSSSSSESFVSAVCLSTICMSGTVSSLDLRNLYAQCRHEGVGEPACPTANPIAAPPVQSQAASGAAPPSEQEPPIRASTALRAKQRAAEAAGSTTTTSTHTRTGEQTASSTVTVRPRSSRLALAREKALQRELASSSDSDDSGSSTN